MGDSRSVAAAAILTLWGFVGPGLAGAQDASDALASPAPARVAASDDERAPPPSPDRFRRFHLALGTHGGIADAGDGPGGFFAWGLTLGFAVTPEVTVGITRLGLGVGYSSIEGTILNVDLTPYVELGFPASPEIRVFGRLGVAMQATGETNVRPGSFGASGFLSLGGRLFPVPWLSLELELALYLPMTDPVVFGGMVVSPVTAAGTFGGAVGLHF